MPNIARCDCRCPGRAILFPGIDRSLADIQPLSGSGTAGRIPLARRSPERAAMNRLSLAVSIALLTSGSAAALIAAQAKPAPTFEAALARSWEEVHNKILT